MQTISSRRQNVCKGGVLYIGYDGPLHSPKVMEIDRVATEQCVLKFSSIFTAIFDDFFSSAWIG